MKTRLEVGIDTSGQSQPVWIDKGKTLKLSKLQKHIDAHTVIVGGGIAGLSVAYHLAKAGKKVVLVEDGLIASGETGRTTAHFTYALDDRFYNLIKMHGKKKARLAAESHKAAIDRVEDIIKQHNIDCDFSRVDGYLFADQGQSKQELFDERDALHKIGFTQVSMTQSPLSFMGESLHFPNQAQLHIVKYMHGLVKAILAMNGLIFIKTHAQEINKDGIITSDNWRVNAKNIVVATNSPVNERVVMHTKQGAYRTYVIAMSVPRNALKPALYWDTGIPVKGLSANPYHYIRLSNLDRTSDLLIVGGEDHKTGQANDAKLRYANLENWTRKRFPMGKRVVYKWSGQVMEPVDGFAYIGNQPLAAKNMFIATGDSGNGMTHGTIAGMLITDRILGIKNKWEKIYSPSRKPVHAIKGYVQENLNVAKQYGQWAKKEKTIRIASQEGTIMQNGLKKIAVYKDEKGKVHTFSAVCPHLGCIVEWNTSEKTFDCPCHGSRFTCQGKVVNGPANEDLR